MMKKIRIFVLLICAALLFASCDLLPEKAFDPADKATWFDEVGRALSEAEVRRIYEGMTFEQIVNILGKPQREVGKDMYVMEWDIDEGTKLDVYFGKASPNTHGGTRREGDLMATKVLKKGA